MYNKSLFGGSSKIYLFVLFNDCLIYGTRGGRLSSGVVKHVLPLIGMSIEDERDDEKKKVKNGFKINSNTKSFVVCAANGPTKQSWVKALKDQIQLANISASTLQKGQQAADAFERMLKNKQTKEEIAAQNMPTSTTAGGSVIQTSKPAMKTIPIQSSASPSNSSFSQPSGSINQGSFSGPTHTSHGSFSQNSSSYNSPPPPPVAPSAYASPPPPPAPSAYSSPSAPPPPPRPSPSAPSYSASPPPPPVQSRMPPPAPPMGYTSPTAPVVEANYEYTADTYQPPEPEQLQYDIPIVGAAAPVPPPMVPSAPAVSSPKQDLLSQIQAGKALKSTEPQWRQILDPSSGAYYYEHKTTGESTWDAPSSFIPAPGAPNASAAAGPARVEDKLKQTLDRYRQFVQDEEDDVQECGDDEWD